MVPDSPKSDRDHRLLNLPVAADPLRSLPCSFGRFELLERLGAGEMGTVFRGRDIVLDREVAIKVPQFRTTDVSVLVKRFHREARAIARLSHPSICPIYDVGEFGGHLFIAMGCIRGQSLDQIAGHGRFLKPEAAVRLVYRICLAMQHAHDRSVIHRDLKTGNIMVAGDGTPVVLDFGLALLKDEKDTGLSRSGQMLGSPAYMSPEQINGTTVDHRTDIFSLGVVFYEALTGQRPFQGSLTKVLLKISRGSFRPPEAVRQHLSHDVSEVCRKMMDASLEKRFQSMAEVAAVLEKILAEGTANSGTPVRLRSSSGAKSLGRANKGGRTTKDGLNDAKLDPHRVPDSSRQFLAPLPLEQLDRVIPRQSPGTPKNKPPGLLSTRRAWLITSVLILLVVAGASLFLKRMYDHATASEAKGQPIPGDFRTPETSRSRTSFSLNEVDPGPADNEQPQK